MLTAAAISGRIATIRYIKLPMICRNMVSSADLSDSADRCCSLTDWSRGVDTGLQSDMLNRLSIWSTKCSWSRVNFLLARSQSTRNPRKWWISSQSFILNTLCNSNLSLHIDSVVFVSKIRSLIQIAMILIELSIELLCWWQI